MNFNEELNIKVQEIENILNKYLPEDEIGAHKWSEKIVEAMNYSLMAGGKRLRPMLMQETYKLLGGSGEEIEPFMAAIEMIHTYSLVHDDLPAMDNDEYRRGKKTTHIVYGEAMGILAGDGLLNYAFETALKAYNENNADNVIKALSILADKAGIFGMIGGQVADIEAENLGDKVTEEHLMYIHGHKTAALIQAAMMVGAVLAGADEEKLDIVEKAAYEIGIAFQIQDDILDVTSTFETLGKPVGSDEKNNKTTYVTLKGIDEATHIQKQMSSHAIQILETLSKENGLKNEFLIELISSLITRIK